MIYQTIDNASQFRDAFPTDRQKSYSYEGFNALYDYFEDMGEDMELDAIAICCEFSEYPSALECISDCGYDFEADETDSEEAQEEAAREYLQENTTLLVFTGGIIIGDF